MRCRALLLVVALVVGPLRGPAPAADAQVVVRRLAGAERAATAAAVARDGWTTAGTVVIADGGDPVAALVAGHLAARRDMPLLLSGVEVPPVTAAAAADLGASRAVVIGTAAAPTGLEVRRITAGGPAELAASAVRAVPGPDDLPVVLVSQATFADALAAANLAPARLLLTDPDTLSPATADLLDELAPDEVVVVGGEAAISAVVAESVAAHGPAVRRVAGGDRYATALAAARAGEGPVAVASGQDFADAVAVLPWVARQGAALVLTTQVELPADLQAWVADRAPVEVVVLGGTAAVGTFAERQVGAAATGAEAPGFEGLVRAPTAAEREAMTGPVWRPGCPVGLDELRVVELAHFDLTGDVVDDGRLVVHADHAEDVLDVAQVLFEARFPLAQVQPIETFGGDDGASMAANNSSGFNCRTIAGSQTWSEHAHGRAVDLNPVQNPYVRGDVVDPPAGRDWLDRADVRPGMIVRPGPVVEAFAAIGWGWGGDFSTAEDYQHFSATGR